MTTLPKVNKKDLEEGGSYIYIDPYELLGLVVVVVEGKVSRYGGAYEHLESGQFYGPIKLEHS